MLPAVDSQASLEQIYLDYLTELQRSNFKGDVETSYSSRLAVATDNSVYQKLPQAVVFPKSVLDLQEIGRLAAQYTDVKFSARGGGTGTNGQSLTSGIVVDVSRHMNQILEINPEQGWVRVQAGVVKDQLNDALAPHGFFFAPDLSTSNRATIGGMINTDASGQGSLVYGKTSDHVLEITSVLANGDLLETAPKAVAVIDDAPASRETDILKQLRATCVGKREKIIAKFPRLNRFLTGYDLEHGVSDDLSAIDIGRVITGSEGSLAFVAEAKLNVTPIAKFKALVNVKYDSFESALRHAPVMVAAQATSVETVDSNVLNLAKADIVWHSVKELIQDVPGKEVLGLNMVEYNSNDQAEIEGRIASLSKSLEAAIEKQQSGVIGFQITYDKADILKIYGMRKKAVGLLGKTDGWKKPVAFAEDTAVPPENLADFIMEFRALLDAKGLYYGMFGHVDAGVLHVRPALDLCDPEQESLMKSLSDEVVKLVAKYGGLMWGEHGKGYRSEYGPEFFGDELFAELRKIKTAFDPHNQMNPGKICTPIDSEESLVKVTDLKRGEMDRQIPISVRDSFAPAMSCNGNGLCFNYDVDSPMCPSSKVTRDRRHSPKGRAGMMREWLRLLSDQGANIQKLESASPQSFITKLRNSLRKQENDDFSVEVFDAMDGCLACKACKNQCPINVDVPSFRARFLAIYYQRYLRPFKDHLVANIEWMAPLLAKFPKFVNKVVTVKPVQSFLNKGIGYVDTPLLSVPTLQIRLESEPCSFNLEALRALEDAERHDYLLIVQDPFTSFYEAEVVEDLINLAKRLGKKPILLPFKPNGKPQHVKGFLARFAKTAKNSAQFLNQLSDLGIPMVGIDPSMVLCYRDEYAKTLKETRGDFEVLLVHEWLSNLDKTEYTVENGIDYSLLAHCTEKTVLPGSEKQWQSLFAEFGLSLNVIAVGCCGMAGTYGHEASHLEDSKGIFDMSWSRALEKIDPTTVVATGYSCRSQVKRFSDVRAKHPLQVLLKELQRV